MYFGERWSLQFRKNIFFPFKYCCLKKDPSLAPSGGANVICKNPERPRRNSQSETEVEADGVAIVSRALSGHAHGGHPRPGVDLLPLGFRSRNHGGI